MNYLKPKIIFNIIKEYFTSELFLKHISIMKEAIFNFLRFMLYFIITIVGLSSIGVWIPLLNDKATVDSITESTWSGLPLNLITYSIAIVMVSFIDRLLHLFKNSNKYYRNEMEFLCLIVLLAIGSWLVYEALVDLKFKRVQDAISYSIYFTILSWFFWIYVKVKTPMYNNYSTLGGQFN